MATPEGKVQATIREGLRSLGYWCLKMQIVGIAGYPDLFCFGHGRVFLIEVKKGKSKPRGLQTVRQRTLNRAGIECEWFDNPKDAYDWVQNKWHT